MKKFERIERTCAPGRLFSQGATVDDASHYDHDEEIDRRAQASSEELDRQIRDRASSEELDRQIRDRIWDAINRQDLERRWRDLRDGFNKKATAPESKPRRRGYQW